MAILGGRSGRKPEPEPEPHVPQDDGELTEQQMVVAWKFLMLLDEGFSADQAQRLLELRQFDWHEAERLLRRGATHEQAVRLLT